MEISAPNHIGFILDGNRRWAKQNGLTSLEGHRAGYENLKTIARETINHGAKYVSAFIFSVENWNRSEEEVSYLLDLALWLASHELKELEKEEIQVVFLGSRDKLSNKLKKAITRAEDRTKHFTRATLALCFNYGGQQEIVHAIHQLMQQSKSVDNINVADITNNLYHSEIPPIDLVIRTSGEQRLSNFMTWRTTYSELIFCSKFWPDYSPKDLEQDIATYNKRIRRFGK